MIKEFIQLIYPEFCAGCGDQLQFSEKAVCSSCLVELRNYSFTSAKSFFGRHIAEDEIYLFNNFKNKSWISNLSHLKVKIFDDVSGVKKETFACSVKQICIFALPK